MQATTIFFTLIIGLCLGSFIHLAINRYSPEKLGLTYLYDITLVGSKCGHCQHNLDWLSLLPVFSWLLQYRRCKYCQTIIPVHYPLTELAVAGHCLMVISIYGLTITAIILIILGCYFTILAIIDYKYLLLPNFFTYPLLLSGLILAYYQISFITFYDAILGAIYGYALLWIPSVLYYLIKKRLGLGGGDIKLLAGLGTWLHYSHLPTLLILASITGLGYAMIQRIFRKTNIKNMLIPFGSCLLLCCYILLLFLTI